MLVASRSEAAGRKLEIWRSTTKYATLQVPARSVSFPHPSPRAAPRRPAFRAQPLPQEVDSEPIRARDRGRRGDDVEDEGGLHEGKIYIPLLALTKTVGGCRRRLASLHRKSHTTRRVFVEIRPARQNKNARTVIYSRRHESHPIRPADRRRIDDRTLLSHDDATAPHQVAHRGVRRRHPRPPIIGVTRGSEPPRRLRRSAGLARLTSLEDPERLRGDLGLIRCLARALRRRRRCVVPRG